MNITLVYIYKYIKLQSVCLSVCLSVCSCLFTGLTAAPVNLIFGMHTHIRRDCVIGYMILTFEVIKGHFRSNKFLCKVPWPHLTKMGNLLTKMGNLSLFNWNEDPAILLN